MKRTVKICLKALFALSLLVVVVASAAALRILYSPVGIPYATEMVERETERLLPGWTINFDEAELGWGWSEVRPWVRMGKIKVIDPTGTIDVRVDDARLGVSRRDIMTGKLTIRTILLDHVQVKSRAQGTAIDIWSYIDTKKGPRALAPLIEDLFKHSSQLNKGMMRLNSISIRNLNTNFTDKDDQPFLSADIPNFDFQSGRYGLNLSLNGSIEAGDNKIDLRFQAKGDVENKKLTLDWDSDPVNLAAFTSNLPVPEPVSYIDAPVSLALSLEADAEEGLLSSDIYIDVGKGQLLHDTAYPIGAEIDYLTADIEFDKDQNSFRINSITGEVKDYELNGEGLVYFEQGIARPGIIGELSLNGLTLPELKIYWPNFGRNTAKKWVVANMTTGSFSDVKFLVDMDTAGNGAYRDGSVFDLTFKFEGLDAKYSKTLPILTDGKGYSRLTRTMFDLTATAGQVDGMAVGTSTFVVHDIHKRGEAYSISNVHIAAPMEDLLHFTAFAPISLNDKMKIAPERIKGYAITDTVLRIPMVQGVKLNDIEFTTRVQGSDVEVHDLLKGEGVRRGTVDLTVDKRGLTAIGNIALNGVDMHATWQEDFLKAKVDGANTTTFHLTGDIDADDLKAFNVDISSFLDGKVTAEATFTGRKFQITEGHFTADATNAIINVDQMAWQKIVGRPTIISGSMEFSPQEITMSPLIAHGPDIDFSGDLYWKLGEDSKFMAELNANKMDNNQFTATIERAGLGAYHANIAGREVDIRPFLEFQSEGEQLETPDPLPMTTYITLSADKAHFLNGVDAENLTLQSTFTEDGPQESKAQATFAGGKNVDLAIFVEDNATRSLWIKTEDGGQLLKGIGIFSHGRGGNLSFDGQIEGWGKALELKGEALSDNMKVVPVSMVGEEATSGVIAGIDEIVGSTGTDFDKLVIPFKYDKGLLDMNGMRASGNRIGLTLEGQIDYNSQIINMNGVYVPVYGLNAAIGNIPIIGNILTGGKGQGIFGVAYRVKGQLDEPKVTINPLSGIAPGIFRRIFEGRKGKVSDVKEKDLPKKPEGEGDATEKPVGNQGGGV